MGQHVDVFEITPAYVHTEQSVPETATCCVDPASNADGSCSFWPDPVGEHATEQPGTDTDFEADLPCLLDPPKAAHIDGAGCSFWSDTPNGVNSAKILRHH